MEERRKSPSPEQLGVLINAIETQSKEVVALRAQTEKQSEILSSAKILVKWVIMGLITALFVGVFGVYAALHANHLISVSKKQTQERSIASCLNQNDFYEKHNALVDEDENTLKLALSNAQSEAAQTFLQKRIEAYELNKVKLRDCTPAGVKKYLTTSTTRGG